MLWWLAENSVMAGALAAIVATLSYSCRLRPAVRYALWLVVLAKLIVPPILQWPWALPDFGPLSQPEPITSTESLDTQEPSITWRLVEPEVLSLTPQAQAFQEANGPARPELESAEKSSVASAVVTPAWWQSS